MGTPLSVRGQNDDGKSFELMGLSIRRFLHYELDGREHIFEVPNSRVHAKSADIRDALRTLGAEVLQEYVRIELDDAEHI